MDKVKFAVIGAGRIAQYHADVIYHLGHSIEAVMAKSISKNLDDFASQYNITKKYNDLDVLIKNELNNIDCFLVLTPWDITETIIKKVLAFGKPVMAEKPIVLSMESFKELQDIEEINNLFIAYNRRYYDFIPRLKEILNESAPVYVDVLNAEPLKVCVDKYGDKIKNYMPFCYTSHVIDLLGSILGSLNIKKVEHLNHLDHFSNVIELESSKYKCPIHIKAIMDAPANSYVRIYLETIIVELMPFEKVSIYNKIDRQNLNGNIVYVPSIEEELTTDKAFKPGFLNQMSCFIDNYVKKSNSSMDIINDLKSLTEICATITNARSEYGKSFATN